MFGELLTDRDGAADIGLDGGNGRRRRDVEAEDAFDDLFATEDGRGGGAVRRDFEHAGLSDEAAARAIRRDRHAPHRHAFHAGGFR